MVKQGGSSYNSGPGKKRGILARISCSVCGRNYKQSWTMLRHLKNCKEYSEAKGNK